MTNDLKDQIRSHFRNAYAESEPVAVSEVDDRSTQVAEGPTVAPARIRLRPVWVVAGTFLLTMLLVGVIPLLNEPDSALPEAGLTASTVVPIASSQTVEVTVSELAGRSGQHLAGVLYEGELTDLDDEAVGGFWSVIPDDEATTEVMREPAELYEGVFPFVSADAATLTPGTYTLVLWLDNGLSPVSRWVPVNSDGMGLYGCHVVFDINDADQTKVDITPTLQPDGWNTNCNTGQTIPGTNTNAVHPPESSLELGGPLFKTAMPPVTGLSAGQTVEVTVSELAGRSGQHLAGVLYEGELTDLDDEAVGGFWSVIPDDEATTEVMREPAELYEGVFPFVSADAATLTPGTYTLVLWLDNGLSPVSRWVPVNSDGMGLYGCHVVFDINDADQTKVDITPTLQPDGWNTNCNTGQTIPGTNTNAVHP
ncbi:MAG: hypothetical protein U9N56_04345 [Actinomycetota bacterium]|nr:hypothetical protein [Actinomycetota bacterium]